MLSRIKNVCAASKDQNFIHCLKQRVLTTAGFHPNRPSVELVILRLSSRLLLYHSSVNLYNLEKHRLIFNTAMIVRKFAKDTEVPTMESHPDKIKENPSNIILKREKDRLKQKGVMKDMPIKIPEAIAEFNRTKYGR